MKAVTTIEKLTDVLVNHVKECDGDELLAIFDYTFGTSSCIDKTSFYGKIIVEPGRGDEYGGIIEEEFKEEITK